MPEKGPNGLRGEAEEIKHAAESTETKADFLNKNADRLQNFLDHAITLWESGSDQMKPAIKSVVDEVDSYLETRFGIDLNALAVSFSANLNDLLADLADTPISVDEMDVMLGQMSEEELRSYFANIDIPGLTPQQMFRLEQVSMMQTLLTSLREEVQKGGKTWTMWAARLGASKGVEENALNVTNRLLDKLSGKVVGELILNPDATLESLAPVLQNFFANPPGLLSNIMSPVNFGEVSTLAELENVRAQTVQSLRNMKHYSKAGVIMTNTLRTHLEAGAEKISDWDKKTIELNTRQEVFTEPRYSQVRKTALENNVGSNSLTAYMEDVIIALSESRALQQGAVNVDIKSIPAHLRPMWNQYNDAYGVDFSLAESWNVSDTTRDWLTEELVVNAAFLATGTGAALAGAKLGAGTVGFIRGTRLAKYLSVATRSSAAAQKVGGALMGATALGVEEVTTQLYSRGLNLFANELELKEALSEPPPWISSVFTGMLTLGLVNKGEARAKSMLKLKPGSKSAKALENAALMVKSPVGKKFAKELILKGPVGDVITFFLGAIQNGDFEGDVKSFYESLDPADLHGFLANADPKMLSNKWAAGSITQPLNQEHF